MHSFFSVKPKMSLFLFKFISHLSYQISFSNLKVGTLGQAVLSYMVRALSELLLSPTSSCAASGVVLGEGRRGLKNSFNRGGRGLLGWAQNQDHKAKHGGEEGPEWGTMR